MILEIEITKAQVAALRRVLKSERQGESRSAEDSDVRDALVAEIILHCLDSKGRPGMCKVCGCTEHHACAGGCSWADDRRTICSQCVPLKSRQKS